MQLDKDVSMPKQEVYTEYQYVDGFIVFENFIFNKYFNSYDCWNRGWKIVSLIIIFLQAILPDEQLQSIKYSRLWQSHEASVHDSQTKKTWP